MCIHMNVYIDGDVSLYYRKTRTSGRVRCRTIESKDRIYEAIRKNSYEINGRTGAYCAHQEMAMTLDAALNTIVASRGHCYAVDIYFVHKR